MASGLMFPGDHIPFICAIIYVVMLAGLFLFVPLLDRIDLQAVVTAAGLPSSQMIPAAQAVRSLLALKLIGTERKSHVMDLVTDQAIALFAGINVVPKRSYLAAYSSRIDHKLCLRFMERSSRPACPMAPRSTWTFIACFCV